jgi:GntR family transcriptional regulator, transcriptional repressor for pyruvate dehydrogenase complex
MGDKLIISRSSRAGSDSVAKKALAAKKAPRYMPSDSSDGTTLRLPKAAELVAHQLRNQIIRGELAEGKMLPAEMELARMFGVSRPTLREAVRILESEQLLEMSRGLHGGAKVLKPSSDVATRYFGNLLQSKAISLTDVYRTRAMIEPAAVRLLARDRDPRALEALRECLEDLHDTALGFSRFHQVIIEQTGVATLILLMGMLNTILDRYFVAVRNVMGKYTEPDAEARRASRARKKLLDHIEAGDQDAAADLWRRYLQEAEEKLKRWQPTELVVDLLQNEFYR